MNTKFKDEGYNKKESSTNSGKNVYGGRTAAAAGADANKMCHHYGTTGATPNTKKNSKSGFFNY